MGYDTWVVSMAGDHNDLRDAGAAHRGGRLGDAEAACWRVLGSEPGNATALNLLGLLCQETNRPDQALLLLRRAVEFAPEMASARNNLAAALGRPGRPTEAVEALRHAVRLAADHAD